MESSNPATQNSKFEGELSTTEKGLLRFDGSCWRKMDDKGKEFVREYNAAVKFGEAIDKVSMPKGITVKVRRAKASSPDDEIEEPKKTDEKKRKGMTFGLSETDSIDDT